MAKRLQLRRGSTVDHSTFTGAIAEVTVDTDKKELVLHDGSTLGGINVPNKNTLATSVGASTIGFNPLGIISSTNVQNAINEVVTDLSASTGASLIGNTPSGTITSTTVQAAINELNNEATLHVNSISELLSSVQGTNPVIVKSYHLGLNKGGKTYYWNSTGLKNTHNGGTIIDPTKTFPTDWSDQIQIVSWFTTNLIGAGVWESNQVKTITGLEFGAIPDWDGSTGTNNSASINAALKYLKVLGGGTLRPEYGRYYFSSGIGNAAQDLTDWNHNTTISGRGAEFTFSGSYHGILVCLQGNDTYVHNLKVDSTRTIDHHGDLDAQRVIYQLGVITGGKVNVGSLSDFVANTGVKNCKIRNTNQPLAVNRASIVRVFGNYIENSTDVGLILQDCGEDLRVEKNNISKTGDDNIFACHYPTSPWALAGKYCGNLFIKENVVSDSFGKNIGVGGYGNVWITDNTCSLSYAGGVNIEKDDWYKTNAENYCNYKISGNIIDKAGRNWSTTEPNARHQSPAPGINPSGIHTVYQNTFGAINITNVEIERNVITNPYNSCIALQAITGVYAHHNVYVFGSMSHGGSAVDSTGVPQNIVGFVTDSTFTKNKTSTRLGVTPAYTTAVASGGGTTSGIIVNDNYEVFTTEAVTYSDGAARDGTTYSTTYFNDTGTITFNSVTSKVCTLTRYQPDTNYKVTLGQQDGNVYWIANKSTSQFTIYAQVTSTGTVDWVLTR